MKPCLQVTIKKKTTIKQITEFKKNATEHRAAECEL